MKIDEAKAEFDAHMAKQMSVLYKLQAQLTAKQAEMGPHIERYDEALGVAGVAEETAAKVEALDGIMATFLQAVDEAVEVLDAKTEPKKVVGGATRRENGKLIADVEYDDGTTRQISAVRKNGELQIEPESAAGASGDMPQGN